MGSWSEELNQSRSHHTLKHSQTFPPGEVTMMMLKLLSLMSLLVMTRCEGVEESVQDQESSSSSLHYNFNHKYGFHAHHSPYAGYKHKHGHHLTDIGKDSLISS